MALSAAKGPSAGAGAAAISLFAKSALKGNVLAVAVIGVVDLVAWQKGMLSDDGKFVSDLPVEFGMDVAKAAVSAVVAGFVMGCICLGFAAVGITSFPVFVLVAGGISVSVLVGMRLDYIDETSGFTKGLRNRGNEVEKNLIKAFDENIVEPLSRMLYQLERHIEWIYLRQCRIPYSP